MSRLRRAAQVAEGALGRLVCRRLPRLFLPATDEARASLGHRRAPTSPVSETDPTIMAAKTTRPSLRAGAAPLCACSADFLDQKSSEKRGSSSCCGGKRTMVVTSLYSIVAVSNNMGIGKDGKLPWPPLRCSPASFLSSRALPRREKPQLPACIACLGLESALNYFSEWVRHSLEVVVNTTRLFFFNPEASRYFLAHVFSLVNC